MRTFLLVISIASLAACAAGGPAGMQADGKLTEANIAKLRNGAKAAEVRELVGAPYHIQQFPRLEREVWTYKVIGPTEPQDLYVQLGPDGVVREVMMMPIPHVVPD